MFWKQRSFAHIYGNVFLLLFGFFTLNSSFGGEKAVVKAGSLWTSSFDEYAEFVMRQRVADLCYCGPEVDDLFTNIFGPDRSTAGVFVPDAGLLNEDQAGKKWILFRSDAGNNAYNRLHEAGHAIEPCHPPTLTNKYLEELRLSNSHLGDTRHGLRVRQYMSPEDLENLKGYHAFNKRNHLISTFIDRTQKDLGISELCGKNGGNGDCGPPKLDTRPTGSSAPVFNVKPDPRLVVASGLLATAANAGANHQVLGDGVSRLIRALRAAQKSGCLTSIYSEELKTEIAKIMEMEESWTSWAINSCRFGLEDINYYRGVAFLLLAEEVIKKCELTETRTWWEWANGEPNKFQGPCKLRTAAPAPEPPPRPLSGGTGTRFGDQEF